VRAKLVNVIRLTRRSEQNEVDGMKKGADFICKVMYI